MTRARFAQLILIVAIAPLFLAAEPVEKDNQGWAVASNGAGIVLYSRLRAGSSVKEFKAVGEIEASTATVHQVIDDVDNYVHFMPFMAECRVLKHEENSTITYQRVSAKICSDRDYTLRIDEKSWPGEGGLIFLNRWQPANELGPPPKKGVLRVAICEGSWLLEPSGDGKTRGTYSVFTDSGGALPVFIANGASAIGIRRVFAAVRKQVKDPKYSKP
jgi:hypothetical protein